MACVRAGIEADVAAGTTNINADRVSDNRSDTAGIQGDRTYWQTTEHHAGVPADSFLDRFSSLDLKRTIDSGSIYQMRLQFVTNF